MRHTVLLAVVMGALHMPARARVTPAPLDPVTVETASEASVSGRITG